MKADLVIPVNKYVQLNIRYFTLVLSILFSISLFFTSCCASKKTAVSGIPEDKSVQDTTRKEPESVTTEDAVGSVQALLKKIREHSIAYHTFSGKAEVDYFDTQGNKYGFQANIRMMKDSVLWISLNAVLGIEVARIMLTSDSVKILDKQNKVVIQRTQEQLKEIFGLPLNLQILQGWLTATPLSDEAGINIIQNASDVAILQFSDMGKTHTLIYDVTGNFWRSEELNFGTGRNSIRWIVDYSGYENKNNFYFPLDRNVSITENFQRTIKIRFKSYVFNEKLSFPFSIPKNYEKN
ncbi:MAG: DUF4292 domain-containing protein [Chitinophagaceae bacterium]|nr:DUF4292 domain-containing protein [Chitinophagaceae bacterium]